MIALAVRVGEYLWRNWRVAIGIVAAVVAAWFLHGMAVSSAYNRAFNAGWSALAKANADAANKALTVNDAAKDKAATERVNDTAIISNQQEARNDAISKAPPSSTGAATRAANCVRWSQQHPTSKTKPAGC